MPNRFEDSPQVEAWFKAAQDGDTTTIEALLRGGMDVDTRQPRVRRTALMVAVRGQHLDLISILLAHRPDLALEDCYEWTAVTWAVRQARSWPDDAATGHQPDRRALDLLLAAGGQLRLYDAVSGADVELVRQRLGEGASANKGARTYHGSMLQIAAGEGHREIARLLLDHGADTEATDDLGQRPLMVAAAGAHLEVVRLLLDRDADIDAFDWSRETALGYAAASGHRAVVDLLLEEGAEPWFTDSVVRNDVAVLESLLEQRASRPPHKRPGLDSVGYAHSRPAMLAARLGHLAALRLLLDHGSALSHRSDQLDVARGTGAYGLLAEAAAHGHVGVVRLLLDRGADVHAMGPDGMTARRWAERNGHDEVARVLRQAEADHVAGP